MLLVNNVVSAKRLVLLLCLCCAVAARAYEDFDAEKIYEHSRPAIVLLIVYDGTEKILGTGTGFFASGDGKLFTSLHVIEGAARVIIRTSKGETLPARGILKMDKKNDIVLLQTEAEDTPFLEITQSAPIPLGSQLAVIGNPLGKEGVLTEGKLNLKGDWQDDRNLVASVPTAPGSSGSPAINYRNEVVGIVKATSVSTRPICIIVPGEHLRGMLAQHPAGSANQLTEFSEVNWGNEYKIRLDPDYQQGVLYCAAGDYTNGFKALSRVNERFPNNAELLLRLGSCALAQNQVLDALRILRQSASLNPEEPWVWCYIGQAHFKMQEQDQAIENFGRAVKLQDDLYEAWLVQGSAYAAKGKLKEAVESLEKAATINPDDVTVWNALGQCHMHMNQKQQAVSTMEKAVAIAPENVLAWELLIAAYTKNGQDDRKWDAEKKLKALREKK